MRGTGTLKPKLSDVLDIFTKGGYEVTVYPTQKPHDAVEKIRSFREEYDLLVCSGGDGTLDEAVDRDAASGDRYTSRVYSGRNDQ